eukprot:gene14682-biopygen396
MLPIASAVTFYEDCKEAHMSPKLCMNPSSGASNRICDIPGILLWDLNSEQVEEGAKVKCMKTHNKVWYILQPVHQ